MGEIKSAFELAMEKVEKLGKLSRDELRKVKEEEYITIGEALARKYLEQNQSQIRELMAAIDKYQGEAREMIIQAFLRRVSQAVSLEDYEKPLYVILELREGRGIEQICHGIEGLCRCYQEAKQRMSDELGERLMTAKIRELEEVGISGSAIEGANVESDRKWREAQDEFRDKFKGELEQYKQKLDIVLFGDTAGR